ncbi:MAG: phenylalanine--tRNA ligase subunit beta [Lachnospiraceae bacterium]|jgi:phenylalanyl-tRNA synthetase beta chain
MNTSLSWIKQYVPDLNVSAKEYADAMTLSGTKVECFEELDSDLKDIVVGQVISVENHPDSDHLHICMVDVGGEAPLQIVCGAPNVAAGQKVPVVLVGGRVAGSRDGEKTAGGIEIKAGKLRGVESFGMICSIEELGSSREFYPEAPEYGIYVFEDDAVVGSDAIEALGLHDSVIEYEITSNRVDCYSVIGIAREAAATFGLKFNKPEPVCIGNEEKASDYIEVCNTEPELCPRYCARVVKNVKIGPSPKWMQRYLASCGIRPINNIVDITNYIMEEYGQPMHSFDYDMIGGHKIVVRRADDGEKFITLDGQERNLDKDVLMICDADKPVAIAGIMGGENSMITENATSVLFEAACFNGTNIRLSTKRIGLSTDSSAKFDKGLDPNNALEALNRACELVEMMDAGEVVGGVVDSYPNPVEPVYLPFEPEKINALLGTDISPDEMLAIFEKIELSYDADSNMIMAPTFRQDIKCMADLAEEVARFYGYDKIGTTLPSGEATAGKLTFEMRIEDLVREACQARGFSQGYCYSFESPKVFDKLLLSADAPERKAIRIANPLGEDFSVMRTVSLNGMLSSLATNFKRRIKSVKLYELGRIYIPKSLPLEELPDERQQLTLGMYGCGDFYDMKGYVENILENAGMFEKPEYETGNLRPFLHPGRQAEIIYNGKAIGYLGEIHPKAASNYDISARVYAAVLDMPSVCEFASFDRYYTGIAKYPAVTRDISMVVPKDINAGSIEAVIRQRGGKILESCELFDIYEGDQITEGFKSMAYSLSFRHKEKTLTDDEITSAMKKILNGLENLNIVLRS